MIELNIDDLGIDYQDAGPWRSYSFSTHGATIEELWDNATVSEIDQDGGEIDCYGAHEAPAAVFNAIDTLLNSGFVTMCVGNKTSKTEPH